MLPVTLDGVRLFIHVLAATVWVGGQIVLAGLVPALRPAGGEVVTSAARRFQLLAWPAYAVLLVTGIWNMVDNDFSDQAPQWKATVVAKIVAFTLAGACSAGHTVAGRRHLVALAGATAGVALLASLAALFWGVQLRA